jgi:hypothetical protein
MHGRLPLKTVFKLTLIVGVMFVSYLDGLIDITQANTPLVRRHSAGLPDPLLVYIQHLIFTDVYTCSQSSSSIDIVSFDPAATANFHASVTGRKRWS